MATNGRQPPMAGVPPEDCRSSGRSMFGVVIGASSSPPAFGDGRMSFNRANVRMNKPLIINEGGLLVNKKEADVIGKGKGFLQEGNHEGFCSNGMAMQRNEDVVNFPSTILKKDANHTADVEERCSVRN
ncbi:hypothetical protein KFK09_014852 [Dendrobium nobile]|uniref:Uncharacterized protein n=1 Tax=Dendrobium nobile TaxID=94219 RepID=A0A8T3B926_DENNO|nr:hypothetical protein KFK09_014852 [Dendrobium nobile]